MKSGEKPSGYFALCTLDGTLKLMEGDKNLWSVQVSFCSRYSKLKGEGWLQTLKSRKGGKIRFFFLLTV